jgi:hypothetical protein
MKLSKMPVLTSLQRNKYRISLRDSPWGIVAQTPPRSKKTASSQAEQMARNNFKLCTAAMKFVDGGMMQAAIDLAHGRTLYPRDVLMEAMYGKLYAFEPESNAVTIGGLTGIAKIVTTASQTSVLFSSIPQTYQDLILVITGRSSKAAVQDDICVQFNLDTGSNYVGQIGGSHGSSSFAVGIASGSSCLIGTLNGATAPALDWTPCEATIYDYSNTARHKTVIGQSGFTTGSTSATQQEAQAFGRWNSIVGIANITVFWPSGAHFVDGSTLCLYGRG